MNKILLSLIAGYMLWAFVPISLPAQQISSPSDFLGYELGSKFTYHHKVVDYYQYVAERSPRVKLIPYGQTNERRPLMVAVVTAEKNMQRIEEIRQNNLRLSGRSELGPVVGSKLPIVWLSYNVHGDESVSTEAAMAVLHSLLTGQWEGAAEWLENMVVVLDPCINPDGRDRYAHFYNQYGNATPNADPLAYEHNQPWPGGRYNHYLFDLNRDWAWQTQIESRQRMALYRQWMPQVHVDFHEMGMNSPYFFAPAARPYHEVITPWQREFQQLIGRNHARYFDQESWLFFSKEVFDLLYPSYGDTWPTFNGAIGFTYEQGGGGRGGLAVITDTGDTLSLADRIAHHYTTSMSTIEVAYQQRSRLLEEFEQYFQQGMNNPAGPYKSYVIKGEPQNDPATLQAFTELLELNGIQYGSAQRPGRSLKGFDYQLNQSTPFRLEAGDLVISAYQPLSRFVQVLMEPKTAVEDSATYDLTAWALPYVYGLQAFATTERLLPGEKPAPKTVRNSLPEQKPVGYLLAWKDFQDARFLAAAFGQQLRARFAEQPFRIDGKDYDRGTLLFLRTDNKGPQFDEKLLKIANEHQQVLTPVYTGMVDSGKDFGSRSVRYIHAPKVAILGGDGVSPTSLGELWFFMEQQLQYPATMLNTAYLGRVDLEEFDVLILVSGNYGRFSDQILEYVRQGGKVIAFERALSLFANASKDDKPQTQLAKDMEKMRKDKKEEQEADPDEALKKYSDRNRAFLTESVEGAIFRVQLDETHPLAFGLGTSLHLIKRNNTAYPYLSERGWNVGTFQESGYVAGFAGAKLRQKLQNTLAIGQEYLGSGTVVYVSDSPIIRAFWYRGRLLLSNAIFLVD